jgi:uncharacterized membrane protein YfcA
MSLTLIAILCIFLLAGFVKGVTGLGLPTVAVGLLSLMMTPLEAAALVILPSLVTNVWQMLAGPALAALLRRLWPMMAAICLGTWLAAPLAQGIDPRLAVVLLGACLVGYGLFGLGMATPPRVPVRGEGALGFLSGMMTGAVTVVTGVFVVPAVPFLQALGLPRADLVQALGLSFTVSTLALAVSLTGLGQFGADDAALAAGALAAALGGMWVGQRVGQAMSPVLFRRVFFLGLCGLGAYLLWRGLI